MGSDASEASDGIPDDSGHEELLAAEVSSLETMLQRAQGTLAELLGKGRKRAHDTSSHQCDKTQDRAETALLSPSKRRTHRSSPASPYNRHGDGSAMELAEEKSALREPLRKIPGVPWSLSRAKRLDWLAASPPDKVHKTGYKTGTAEELTQQADLDPSRDATGVGDHALSTRIRVKAFTLGPPRQILEQHKKATVPPRPCLRHFQGKSEEAEPMSVRELGTRITTLEVDVRRQITMDQLCRSCDDECWFGCPCDCHSSRSTAGIASANAVESASVLLFGAAPCIQQASAVGSSQTTVLSGHDIRADLVTNPSREEDGSSLTPKPRESHAPRGVTTGSGQKLLGKVEASASSRLIESDPSTTAPVDSKLCRSSDGDGDTCDVPGYGRGSDVAIDVAAETDQTRPNANRDNIVISGRHMHQRTTTAATAVGRDRRRIHGGGACCACRARCWFACTCPCHDCREGESPPKPRRRKENEAIGVDSSRPCASIADTAHNSLHATAQKPKQRHLEFEEGADAQSAQERATSPAPTKCYAHTGSGVEMPISRSLGVSEAGIAVNTDKIQFSGAGVVASVTVESNADRCQHSNRPSGAAAEGTSHANQALKSTVAGKEYSDRSTNATPDLQLAFLATSECRGPRAIHFGTAPRRTTAGLLRPTTNSGSNESADYDPCKAEAITRSTVRGFVMSRKARDPDLAREEATAMAKVTKVRRIFHAPVSTVPPASAMGQDKATSNHAGGQKNNVFSGADTTPYKEASDSVDHGGPNGEDAPPGATVPDVSTETFISDPGTARLEKSDPGETSGKEINDQSSILEPPAPAGKEEQPEERPTEALPRTTVVHIADDNNATDESNYGNTSQSPPLTASMRRDSTIVNTGNTFDDAVAVPAIESFLPDGVCQDALKVTEIYTRIQRALKGKRKQDDDCPVRHADPQDGRDKPVTPEAGPEERDVSVARPSFPVAPSDAILSHRSRVHAVIFPKAHRHRSRKDKAVGGKARPGPGPGQYEIRGGVAAQRSSSTPSVAPKRISLKEKARAIVETRKVKEARLGGPGEYNVTRADAFTRIRPATGMVQMRPFSVTLPSALNMSRSVSPSRKKDVTQNGCSRERQSRSLTRSSYVGLPKASISRTRHKREQSNVKPGTRLRRGEIRRTWSRHRLRSLLSSEDDTSISEGTMSEDGEEEKQEYRRGRPRYRRHELDFRSVSPSSHSDGCEQFSSRERRYPIRVFRKQPASSSRHLQRNSSMSSSTSIENGYRSARRCGWRRGLRRREEEQKYTSSDDAHRRIRDYRSIDRVRGNVSASDGGWDTTVGSGGRKRSREAVQKPCRNCVDRMARLRNGRISSPCRRGRRHSSRARRVRHNRPCSSLRFRPRSASQSFAASSADQTADSRSCSGSGYFECPSNHDRNIPSRRHHRGRTGCVSSSRTRRQCLMRSSDFTSSSGISSSSLSILGRSGIPWQRGRKIRRNGGNGSNDYNRWCKPHSNECSRGRKRSRSDRRQGGHRRRQRQQQQSSDQAQKIDGDDDGVWRAFLAIRKRVPAYKFAPLERKGIGRKNRLVVERARLQRKWEKNIGFYEVKNTLTERRTPCAATFATQEEARARERQRIMDKPTVMAVRAKDAAAEARRAAHLSSQLHRAWASDGDDTGISRRAKHVNSSREKGISADPTRKRPSTFRYIAEAAPSAQALRRAREHEVIERARQWLDVNLHKSWVASRDGGVVRDGDGGMLEFGKTTGREEVNIKRKGEVAIKAFDECLRPTDQMGPGRYETENLARATRTGRMAETRGPSLAANVGREEIVGPRGERPVAAVDYDRHKIGADEGGVLILDVKDDFTSWHRRVPGGIVPSTPRWTEVPDDGDLPRQGEVLYIHPEAARERTRPRRDAGHRYIRFNNQPGRGDLTPRGEDSDDFGLQRALPKEGDVLQLHPDQIGGSDSDVAHAKGIIHMERQAERWSEDPAMRSGKNEVGKDGDRLFLSPKESVVRRKVGGAPSFERQLGWREWQAGDALKREEFEEKRREAWGWETGGQSESVGGPDDPVEKGDKLTRARVLNLVDIEKQHLTIPGQGRSGGLLSTVQRLAYRDAEYDIDSGIAITNRRLATGVFEIEKTTGRADDRPAGVGRLALTDGNGNQLHQEGDELILFPSPSAPLSRRPIQDLVAWERGATKPRFPESLGTVEAGVMEAYPLEYNTHRVEAARKTASRWRRPASVIPRNVDMDKLTSRPSALFGGPPRHATIANLSGLPTSDAFTDDELRDDRLMEGQRLRLFPTSMTCQLRRSLPSTLQFSDVPRTVDVPDNSDRPRNTNTEMMTDRDLQKMETAGEECIEQLHAIRNGDRHAEISGTGARGLNRRPKKAIREHHDGEKKKRKTGVLRNSNERYHQLQWQREGNVGILGSTSRSGNLKGGSADSTSIHDEAAVKARGDMGEELYRSRATDKTEGRNDSAARGRTAAADARARAKIDELDRAFRRSVAL